MRTLTVGLGDRTYPIHIGEGLLTRADLFLQHLPQRKVSVVTNTTVAALYLERLSAALCGAGVDIIPVVLPDGEQYKNWPTLNAIFDTLLSNRSRVHEIPRYTKLRNALTNEITMLLQFDSTPPVPIRSTLRR